MEPDQASDSYKAAYELTPVTSGPSVYATCGPGDGGAGLAVHTDANANADPANYPAIVTADVAVATGYQPLAPRATLERLQPGWVPKQPALRGHAHVNMPLVLDSPYDETGRHSPGVC